jgi:hypothetical protein
MAKRSITRLIIGIILILGMFVSIIAPLGIILAGLSAGK